MAGFWHLSHHQMRDPNGRVYAGAKAYFLSAQTLLPITVYQDYGLGTPHPNPVQANGVGVFPPVFLDEGDGFYRQRVTTAAGVIIPGTDVGTLPIVGPSGGEGGVVAPVDPNALFQTGDLLWLDRTGSRSGWVRDNGRTIGPATSGASERANADTEALFSFLWQTYDDTRCPVIGGRGISASADWAANKQITLLDKRGRAPFGLDDMGNSAAGRLSNVTFSSGNATTASAEGGEALHTLTTPEIPPHPHPATVTDTHEHDFGGALQRGKGSGNINFAVQASAGYASIDGLSSTGGTGGTKTGSIAVSVGNAGGGGAHNNMPPFVLGTFYRKL